jgi:hypothetical protein
MKTERFIYNLNYPIYEKESCEIEVRSLFKFDLKGKVFFESRKIHPSVSPFLKSRLEIMYKASTFLELIESIAKQSVLLLRGLFLILHLKLYLELLFIRETGTLEN